MALKFKQKSIASNLVELN